MNCNTTHYRANSSSVPGDPTYDTTWKVGDDGDVTKALQFSLGGATAGKTMTLHSAHTADRADTLPNASTMLAGLGVQQTFRNINTFAGTTTNILVNSGSGSAAGSGLQLDDGSGSGFVGEIQTNSLTASRGWAMPNASGIVSLRTNSETLTNKTLTTPTIGSFTNATHNHQDAAGGGTLDAAAIASGTLSASRVYAATCKLTSDVGPTTSSTLGNVTGMTLAVAASTYYVADFYVVWQTAGATNGIKLSITVPTGPTIFSFTVDTPINAPGTMSTAGNVQGWEVTSGNAVSISAVNASAVNQNLIARVRVVLVNGTTAGNIQLQYADTDGATNTTIKQGSAGLLVKMP